MLVTFPDGSQRNYEDTATALDIANSISPRLGKATLACEIDGKVCDDFMPIGHDCQLKLLTFEDDAAAVLTVILPVMYWLRPSNACTRRSNWLSVPPLITASIMTLMRLSPLPLRIWPLSKRKWLRSKKKTCLWNALSCPGKRLSVIWKKRKSPIRWS